MVANVTFRTVKELCFQKATLSSRVKVQQYFFYNRLCGSRFHTRGVIQEKMSIKEDVYNFKLSEVVEFGYV